MPSSTMSHENHLQTLLDSARPFLRGELEQIDPNLPSLVAVLKSVGAGECWHKHGTFLDHLVDVYRVLKLWQAPDPVCLCGLFHSAYSNSYVNLAIFDPSTGRDVVRRHVGEEAERLIHLFCVVPRQPLIHDRLLFCYSDAELMKHLDASEISLCNAKDDDKLGLVNGDEEWRKKLRSILPADGITVEHIKTGDDLKISRNVVAVFLLMTIADFSDQLFGFQDELFDNSNGRLEFTGNEFDTTLWPGDGKPGLWMTSLSRMAAIYTLIAREEEILKIENNNNSNVCRGGDEGEEIELVIPPVFNNCTKILGCGEQIMARDLYWEGVCWMRSKVGAQSQLDLGKCEDMLRRCVEKNPFVGEPHVVLSQLCMITGRYEGGQREAEKGLKLLLEWGSPWDKRMSWGGWVAWCRVLLMKAKEKSWPTTSWGILNLGLVQ